MKTKLVEVTWFDSMYKPGWHDPPEVVKIYKEDWHNEPIKTTGYIIEKNKDYLLLAMGMKVNNVDMTILNAHDYFAIPTKTIIEINELAYYAE